MRCANSVWVIFSDISYPPPPHTHTTFHSRLWNDLRGFATLALAKLFTIGLLNSMTPNLHFLSPSLQAAGGMVGDFEVVQALFKELIKDKYRSGVVVDGFPRTKVQADIVRCVRGCVCDSPFLLVQIATGLVADSGNVCE